MKSLYKTPDIKVEELLKADVLCVSHVDPLNPEQSNKYDNYNLIESNWNDLSNLI